ncbi:unnamed protein product [Ixodes hexagonus]
MDSSTSWIVAAGCCWSCVFSFAIFRSAGMVYVATLSSLDTTRAEAAWPVTVMGVLSCLAGPVVGWLATRIAVWKMTVSACLVGALSISACFFANGIWFLVISLGVVHGISMSFSALGNTVIRDHFTCYRTIACGISYAGMTISGLIFPPLVQFLLDKYGPKGMYLITGAVMLNAAAGALLQRIPPETPQKPGLVLDEDEKREISFDETFSEKCGLRECANDLAGATLSPEDECSLTQESFLRKNEKTEGEHDLPDVVGTKISLCSKPGTKNSLGYWEQTESHGKECFSPYHERGTDGDLQEKTPIYGATSTRNRGKVILPTYLRLPKFYAIALACSVILFNMTTYLAVVVDFATDRKVSKWNAVFLLMVYAFADLVSRLGSGWVTDKGFLKKSTMMATNLFLWAVSLCLMPFCYAFYLHVIQAVIVGWCNGATLILVPVLLMELVNTDKFSESFGVATLLAGLPLLPRPLLIGYFRDSLGDYQGLFVLMGVVTALSSFSCLFLRDNFPKNPIR